MVFILMFRNIRIIEFKLLYFALGKVIELQ